MKKILFSTILSASLFFTSFSKDDDNNNVSITKENIQGIWSFVAYQGVNDAEEVTEEQSCESKKDYVDFLADGSSTWNYFTSDCELGGTQNLKDWSLNGKIFTWDFDGSTMDYEILELTKTKFKIRGIDYAFVYVFER